MSHFKDLKDLCTVFEEELRNVSPQLFTARIGKTFEDEIVNKMQDLSLFTSKLRLLQAKTISMTTQSPPALSEVDMLAAYEDTASWKVIEQQTVKAITQSRDVRDLLTTPDSKLDRTLVERKYSIISKLKEYRMKEAQLSEADTMLKSAESKHHELQSQWEIELEELRSLKQQGDEEEIAMEGPLYEQQLADASNHIFTFRRREEYQIRNSRAEAENKTRLKRKLRMLMSKIEIMRWLMSRLVTARVHGYDWLSDPDRRLRALKMAREPNTMEFYTGT